MEQVKKKPTWQMIKDEIFGGWSKAEAIYAWLLIGIQVAFYMIYPESLWGFVAGVSGTICVLFVAKGKISNYFFGFIQTTIMMVLGFQAGLIGETGENIFYFISQFLGIKEWKENMNKETELVFTRKFSLKNWLVTIAVIAFFTAIFGYAFDFFNGTQPYLDSVTLVLAFVAQILMVYRFREQWVLWFLLNVISLYQWFTLGNMSLVALYIAFTINNVYGIINYNKLLKEKETKKEDQL